MTRGAAAGATAVAALVAVGGVVLAADGASDGARGARGGARPAAEDAKPPAELARACRRADRAFTGQVACPAVTPPGPVEVEGAGPLNPQTARREDGYLLDLASPQLGEAHGGHWTVAGGTDPSLAALVDVPGTRARSVRVAGRAATVRRMPAFEDGGGLYGGHVVVTWRDGRTMRQVSVHGLQHERLALRIAASAMRAGPSR